MTRIRDPTKQRAYAATWREKHRDEERQRGKQYRETHQPHLREYMRAWRAKNPDKVQIMSAKSNAKRGGYRKNYYIENRERIQVRNKQRYDTNREQILVVQKAQAKTRLVEARQKLFQVYGARCSCCGETTERFLTLHHIGGGGNEDRAQNTSLGVIRRAVTSKNPKTYEILCFNCHMAIHMNGGICPHKLQRRDRNL